MPGGLKISELKDNKDNDDFQVRAKNVFTRMEAEQLFDIKVSKIETV